MKKKFTKLSMVCDNREGFRLIVSLNKNGKVETSYFNFKDEKPFIHPKKFKLEKEKLKGFLEMVEGLNVFNLEDNYWFKFDGEILFCFGKDLKKVNFGNVFGNVFEEFSLLLKRLIDLV